MGLKKLLPLENYSVESSMSKNEVLGVLSDNSVKSGNTNTTNANFKGEILGDTFKFKQILSYRNDFKPAIYGLVKNNNSGSKTEISMKYSGGIMVFAILWFSCLGLMLLSGLFGMATKPTTGIKDLGGLIFLLLFGYILFVGGFKYESKKVKIKLEEILKSRTAD